MTFRPLTVKVLVAGSVGLVGFVTEGLSQAPEPTTAEIVEAWQGSAHANADAEAFAHWNEEGEIPEACAVCHSGEGFRAFYGFDGSEVGAIGHPIPIGGVVDCATCHDDGVATIQSVRFPSGVEVSEVGSSATCLTCHQGRASTDRLNGAVAGGGEDAVNPELTFINPHYAAAAATLLGSVVRGGYEYAGKSYAGRYDHVDAFSECTACHNPHSLEVRVSQCVECHQGEAPQSFRTTGTDGDGDGDVAEGISSEIDDLHAVLGEAIHAYASQVAGIDIAYAEHSHPYFFIDANGNGIAEPDEAERANAYNAWSPRLLKAAYNYQFVGKDGGAYAHNPHYALQLLIDSIESLAGAAGIDVPAMVRP